MKDRRRNGPIDLAKQLILQQYLRTVGKDRRKEAKEATEDHFFDKENGSHINPQIVLLATKRLQELPERDRAIFILLNSGCLTKLAIAGICGVGIDEVYRIGKVYDHLKP